MTPRKSWCCLLRADNTKGPWSWSGHQELSDLPDAPPSLQSVRLMSAGTVGGLAQASRGECPVLSQGLLLGKRAMLLALWEGNQLWTWLTGRAGCTGLPGIGASAVGRRELDENNQLQTAQKQTDSDPEVWITAPSARWLQEPCQGEKMISHPEFPLCSGPCSLWTSLASRPFHAPDTQSLVYRELKEAFPRLGLGDRESRQRSGFLVPAWVTLVHSCLHVDLECCFLLRWHSQEARDPCGCRAGSHKQGHSVWGKPSGHPSPRQETVMSELLKNWMLACFHLNLQPPLERKVASVSCQTQPPYGSSKSIDVRVRPVCIWILPLLLDIFFDLSEPQFLHHWVLVRIIRKLYFQCMQHSIWHIAGTL